MILDYKNRTKKFQTSNLFFDNSRVFDDDEIKWFKEHNVKCKVSNPISKKDFTIMKPENVTWFHLINRKVCLEFEDTSTELLYRLTW